MTKLIVGFRDFANAPKNLSICKIILHMAWKIYKWQAVSIYISELIDCKAGTCVVGFSERARYFRDIL